MDSRLYIPHWERFFGRHIKTRKLCTGIGGELTRGGDVSATLNATPASINRLDMPAA
jgi:hypothetical protein